MKTPWRSASAGPGTMLRTLLSCLALAASLLSARPALAQESPRLSFGLGVFGGGHWFDGGTNLGVAAAPDASEGARSNGMVGLRASLGVGRWVGLEAEGYLSMTSDRSYDLKATILGYRLNALAFLAPGKLRPFFLVGGGVVEVVETHADGAQGMVLDRDGQFHVGAGLDLRVLDHLTLRADARAVQMPGKPKWSFATDFEAHLGLALTFGAGARAEAGGQQRTAEPPLAIPATTAPAQTAPAMASAVTPPPRASDAPSRAASLSTQRPSSTTPPGETTVGPVRQTPVTSVKELLGRAREIRFEGASSKLSLVSLPFLGQLAEALVAEAGARIEIVSHTAGSGDAKKDKVLSRRRAEAVKQALVQRDVDASRLLATGLGSSEPLAPNLTRNGRRLNDRVQLRLLPAKAR